KEGSPALSALSYVSLPAKMESRLPPEIINIIFSQHADILTQYLNNRLDDEEIGL
ncbi:hypothetical protein HDU76_004952, partial [Blyttiomyces sp. JEL0837]